MNTTSFDEGLTSRELGLINQLVADSPSGMATPVGGPVDFLNFQMPGDDTPLAVQSYGSSAVSYGPSSAGTPGNLTPQYGYSGYNSAVPSAVPSALPSGMTSPRIITDVPEDAAAEDDMVDFHLKQLEALTESNDNDFNADSEEDDAQSVSSGRSSLDATSLQPSSADLFNQLQRRISVTSPSPTKKPAARTRRRASVAVSKLSRDRKARRSKSRASKAKAEKKKLKDTASRVRKRRSQSQTANVMMRSKSVSVDPAAPSNEFSAFVKSVTSGKHSEDFVSPMPNDDDDDDAFTIVKSSSLPAVVERPGVQEAMSKLEAKIQDEERRRQLLERENERLRAIEREAMKLSESHRQHRSYTQTELQKKQLEIENQRQEALRVQGRLQELEHREATLRAQLSKATKKAERAVMLKAELRSRDVVIGELCQRIRDIENERIELRFTALSTQIDSIKDMQGDTAGAEPVAAPAASIEGTPMIPPEEPQPSRGCCGTWWFCGAR